MISVQFNNILWMKWKKLYEVEQSSIMSKLRQVMNFRNDQMTIEWNLKLLNLT